MIPKIQDCSRIEQANNRLEIAKQLFEKALSKAVEACELAKTELTRPLNLVEKEEMETYKENGLEL